MFYVIGLGLGDYKDITVRGLEILKKCSKVYLEYYTSILPCSIEDMEAFYHCSLEIADRELVEENADEILSQCFQQDIALLVVGDPYGATTHSDLVLRAHEKGLQIQVIHNASIINAVGVCGLQLYRFGEIVSLPLWTESWKPTSFVDKIIQNFQHHSHTLCLLDIKVKEPTIDSLVKKKREYMNPRFMTVAEASSQLLEALEIKNVLSVINEDSLCVGLARIGATNQQIVVCTLGQMTQIDLGLPLHSLVVPSAHLHLMERNHLQIFALQK